MLKEYNRDDVEKIYDLLDFLYSESEKLKDIIDSLPLITCLSYTATNEILCGFHITGETATFNTKNIKVTGKEIREGDSEED
jgi:hypothetical protein